MGRTEESGVGVRVEEWGGGWTPRSRTEVGSASEALGTVWRVGAISSLWTRWKD